MSRPIRKLLIANRGEIAVRIAATAHSMGIETVAVFSDADANALHVRGADEAVHIGPAPSRESYLSIPAYLRAAELTGADAVHPGYGFLAENAEFCRAMTEAGLTFVGPTADVIERLGSKKEAKAIAAEAGVPTVPGYDGADQSDEAFAAAAETVGFPLLIKASAGGGGKGMHVVRAAADLAADLARARREARGAFGDATLLLERYVEGARHIEVQVLADDAGNVAHLFERECSIQRRHQKIIEEAPAVIDPSLRARLCDAGCAIARAVGYRNAGTVEFIVKGADFYFLEVNTRLQVEHRVTEAITGIDLVQQQLRIAQGEPLAWQQSDLSIDGAAIECRLYAEDPAAGYLPSTGRIQLYTPPDQAGLLIDSGVEAGSDVTVHYDPMLLKLVAHGDDRRIAIARLRRAVAHLGLLGVTTNRALIRRVLGHPTFATGGADTAFLPACHAELTPAPSHEELDCAALAAALWLARKRTQMNGESSAPSPRREFLLLEYGAELIRVEFDIALGQPTPCAVGRGMPDIRKTPAPPVAIRHESTGPDTLRLRTPDGRTVSYRVTATADRVHVGTLDADFTFKLAPRFDFAQARDVDGNAVAPMPGAVIRVCVEVGERVSEGAPLVVLEAMKMEHTVTAPATGTVTAVTVAVGDQAALGQTLVELDLSASPDD